MSSYTLTNFAKRHIGISSTEINDMLNVIGVDSLDQLIDETVPDSIRMKKHLQLPDALNEYEYLAMLRDISLKNKVYKTFIGQGYYGTITPSVILRNIFENPGWYTQYTPYQAEIAQGRLEALLNFQTMVSDLTGLPIANASLLDEGTAAAEAMAMSEGIHNKKRKTNPATKFFVDNKVYKQTLDVVITRAQPLHIEVVTGDWKSFEITDEYFGVLLQYPDAEGHINDYRAFAADCNTKEIQIVVAADIMSLALLTPPGEWGADIVVGNTQRFGVPIGFGGPHAAFFATKEDNKRVIPGRIIGLSIDVHGNPALRMALQTREQHIRREKATSNICTAQALLAIMAGMYAVYHGPDGIKEIASTIHNHTKVLAENLKAMQYNVVTTSYFDTITIHTDNTIVQKIKTESEKTGINFYYPTENHITISLDETTNQDDVESILDLFGNVNGAKTSITDTKDMNVIGGMERKSNILEHPVFSSYHTESKMMRYIKSLENKDLSLVHSMISLG
ncbi:MAG: hypothetical protein KBF35_10615 [Saprospiraceae bacterium]|nr:hypothetical protein [Saprospiraceae bacterium]